MRNYFILNADYFIFHLVLIDHWCIPSVRYPWHCHMSGVLSRLPLTLPSNLKVPERGTRWSLSSGPLRQPLRRPWDADPGWTLESTPSEGTSGTSCTGRPETEECMKCFYQSQWRNSAKIRQDSAQFRWKCVMLLQVQTNYHILKFGRFTEIMRRLTKSENVEKNYCWHVTFWALRRGIAFMLESLRSRKPP